MKARPSLRWLTCAALVVLLDAPAYLQSPAPNKPDLDARFLDAAGKGDIAAIRDLLDKGVSIEAENWRGATALGSSAEHGHVEIVKLLLDRGAFVDARDLEWGRTPLINITVPPSDKKHADAEAAIMKMLLDRGAGSDGESLVIMIRRGQYEAAKTIINRGKVFPSYLNLTLREARRAKQDDLVDLLIKAGAKEPGPLDFPTSAERLKLVAGVYRNASGQELTLRPQLGDPTDRPGSAGINLSGEAGSWLLLERTGRPRVSLAPVDLTVLRSHDLKTVVRVKGSALPPSEITLREGGRLDAYTRTGDAPAPTFTNAPAGAPTARTKILNPPLPSAFTKRAASEWPSFRGPSGSGVMDGANPPTTWDVAKGINVKWKTPIPGLGHSSPVIWGNRVFITTAVQLNDAQPVFKSGPEGSSTAESANRSTKDDVPHSWRVYALDKQSGKILWERVAYEGVPRTARHVNETQANATPATDGQYLVAFFGSEGLFCYNLDGKLLWKKDLGVLRSGYAMDPTYEWNSASSPIIYKNLTFVQLDLVETSFVAAFDLKSGKEIWRSKREELPSFATPFIYEGHRVELVTLASNYARAYDPSTGRELWRLGKHATHATPMPISANGRIFLTSGAGNTLQPVYSVVAGGEGDITLGDDETSNAFVTWSTRRGGGYLATPIFYRDLLYVSENAGILAAYNADTGERVYQARLPPSIYTSSVVAADGKLYYANVDGDVIVVKAGPKFERLAVNPIGEVIQATPAISQGMIIFRTRNHVIAVADAGAPSSGL